MCSEDTPHYIFINIGSEHRVDLLRDPWASIAWIALFQFNDSLDKFR